MNFFVYQKWVKFLNFLLNKSIKKSSLNIFIQFFCSFCVKKISTITHSIEKNQYFYHLPF